MRNLAAFLIIFSLIAFTIGCGAGESRNEGAPGNPAAGEAPTTAFEPEGEDLAPGN